LECGDKGKAASPLSAASWIKSGDSITALQNASRSFQGSELFRINFSNAWKKD